jgi:hypothetical protein
VTEATPENVAEAEPQPEHSDRGDRGERRGRSGGRDRNSIVGMGDHMPGFIAMSFDERRGGPRATWPKTTTTEDVETDAVTEAEHRREADVAEDAPKPKRRRSRAKKADAPEAEADG